MVLLHKKFKFFKKSIHLPISPLHNPFWESINRTQERNKTNLDNRDLMVDGWILKKKKNLESIVISLL